MSRLLVVNSQLETSGTPIDEVEGRFSLQGGDSGGAVTGDNISTVQQGNGHVLSVTRVANNHLVVWLETLEGQVGDLVGFVGALGSRDNRRIGDQGVVNTREGNQVGLELVEVDVQGSVESEGRGDGGDDLGDKLVKVLVGGASNVEVLAADIVNSLVVDQEGTVGVLDSGVGSENGVVRLDDSSADSGGRVYGEFELALLSVVLCDSLKKKSSES